jgi:hypothetical protein
MLTWSNGVVTLAMLVFSVSAHAELRHVEIKTLGMD